MPSICGTALNREISPCRTVRLLEYATYREILQYLSFAEIVEGWPGWRGKIRSESRRRGFDFLVSWLPEHHPELLEAPVGDREAPG